MESNTNKGSEYKNIIETWDQNEKNKENLGDGSIPGTDAVPTNDLDQMVKEAAAEYDEANKEDRILGGDRATLNDDKPETD